MIMMKLIPGLIVTLLASTAIAQQVPPKPLQTTAIHPVRVEHREDGVYFLDFGRDAFSQLKMQLDHVDDQKIIVCLGEKLTDRDRLDSKPGGSIRYLQTVIVDGVAKLTKADSRRMPTEIGPVMPFRYVELKGLPQGMSSTELTQAVTQIAVNYPIDDRASEFECSDEKLNAVWSLCKYSIKATSYAGVFVDGDRERKPYEADAYINGLGWYCCTSDITLPVYSDRYLIDHPTWPTEWSMFSVICAWNDYLYTGDLETLRAIYPDLKAKSLRALEREDGLITTENVPQAVNDSIHLGREKMKDIVDWPVSERDGYQMRPINMVVNAFHCRSLKLLSQMAAALGKETDAKESASAYEKSLASLNGKLVDSSTGLYLDGEGAPHSSLHANMFPLAFELVPADRREKVLAFVKSRGMACSVYGAQFLLDSLFDHGGGNDAVALILARGDRSWRHMVEDTGTTITLEAWDQKFKPNQDWNHAWGAAPANLIPRKVLGVEPAEPGFTRAIIQPRCLGKSNSITWARGKVPTAKGPITIDWKTASAGLHLNVELPANVSAQIHLPTDWGKRLMLDGKLIPALIDDGSIAVEVGSGAHAIVLGDQAP
jgi:alpha-L-rhamnosidase